MSERDSGEATFTDVQDDAGSDRRQVRYDVDLTVTVNSEHNFLAGAATNLSAGGVFISTSIVHPVGTEFNVSIHLDDGKPGVVRGKGVVRWHQQAPTDESGPPQGLGIQFVQIDGDGEERIRTFLASRKPMDMPAD